MIFVNIAEGKGVNSGVMKYRIFGYEMSYSMYYIDWLRCPYDVDNINLRSRILYYRNLEKRNRI